MAVCACVTDMSVLANFAEGPAVELMTVKAVGMFTSIFFFIKVIHLMLRTSIASVDH